jgi:hypothetical protein
MAKKIRSLERLKIDRINPKEEKNHNVNFIASCTTNEKKNADAYNTNEHPLKGDENDT